MINRRSATAAKSIAIGVSIAAAGSMLAACGSSDSSGSAGGGKVTIQFVWWGNDVRTAATQQAVQLFEKANPNIKVETQFSDYGSYVQKLTTEVAAGATPDVIQLDRPTFGEYASKHVLADLQDYVDSKKLDLSSVDSTLLAGEQYDGDQYAVPAGQTTQMMVYNADTFQKAGVADPSSWTWKDFEGDLAKLKQSTGKAGVTDFGWAIDWFDSWLHQRDKSLYTTSGKLGFTAGDLTEFWTYTDGLRKSGLATAAEVTTKQDGSTTNSALISGDSAIEENYDSNLSGYIGATSAHLKAAPLPTDGTGADASGLAALPPVYFGVPNTSKNKDAAIKLLNFLVNDTQAGAALGVSRGVPENKTIRQQVCSAAAAADQATCAYEQQVADQVGPSKTWAWPQGSSQVKTDFQQVYDTVVFGKATPAKAAAQLISDAQDALQQ